MTEEAKKVFWNIIKCPLISCESGENPCRAIINYQSPNNSHWQIPEPWNGNIESAPILFLLSNPSYSDDEVYPDYPKNIPSAKKSLTGECWEKSDIEDFFENRFKSSADVNQYVERLKVLNRDGSRGKLVRTWKILCKYAFALKYGNTAKFQSIRSRDVKKYGLIEVVENDNTYKIIDDNSSTYTVKAGEDFALTEIVKCKSKDEEGVSSARKECSNRYLDRVLSLFKGETLCIAGFQAQKVFLERYNIQNLAFADDNETVKCGHCEINQRLVNVYFLPHPNVHIAGKYRNGVSINGIRVI